VSRKWRNWNWTRQRNNCDKFVVFCCGTVTASKYTRTMNDVYGGQVMRSPWKPKFRRWRRARDRRCRKPYSIRSGASTRNNGDSVFLKVRQTAPLTDRRESRNCFYKPQISSESVKTLFIFKYSLRERNRFYDLHHLLRSVAMFHAVSPKHRCLLAAASYSSNVVESVFRRFYGSKFDISHSVVEWRRGAGDWAPELRSRGRGAAA